MSSSVINDLSRSRCDALAADGAWLIVSDCSNSNLFATLGLTNPFHPPTIDWGIHQPPKVWARLFGRFGFGNERIRWTTMNHLGAWGQRLLGNRIASCFLLGHFCLHMRRITASP